MAIEIKELHIKINVDNDKKASSSNKKGLEKEALIAECMEQIIEANKYSKER